MNWSCFVKLFNDKINVDYGLKQVVEHTQINWEDWWFWCLLQLKCSLRRIEYCSFDCAEQRFVPTCFSMNSQVKFYWGDSSSRLTIVKKNLNAILGWAGALLIPHLLESSMIKSLIYCRFPLIFQGDLLQFHRCSQMNTQNTVWILPLKVVWFQR